MSDDCRAARVNKLCCLRLDSRATMPAVLKDLHALIPTCADTFIWADERQQVINFLFETRQENAPEASLCARVFFNRRERRAGGIRALSETMLAAGKERRTFRSTDNRCDKYNFILQPSNDNHCLRAVLEGGPLSGRIFAHCDPGNTDLTRRSVVFLSSIIPYLAQALTSPPPEVLEPMVDSGGEGLVIVDIAGKVQFMSAEARRLLCLAQHPPVSTRAVRRGSGEPIFPAGALRMCQRLLDVFEGKAQDVGAPVWHDRKSWGMFVFRSHWLELDAPDPTRLIGVTIRHQEPLPFKVLRQLERLPPLSRRQVQICLLLAAGHPRATIGPRLDISESTVITHTRQLYDKLQVHTRNELVSKLLLLCSAIEAFAIFLFSLSDTTYSAIQYLLA